MNNYQIEPHRALSLVYHTGGLGDFITALPAIAEWNKKNPGCRKILLGKPAYGILGILASLVDEIWDAESPAWSWLYSPSMPVSSGMQDKIKSIQSSILYTSPDSPVLARFRQFGIKNLLFQDPFPQEQVHVSVYHLSLVNKDAARSGPKQHRLVPHPDFKQAADRILSCLDKFVAISPGSGSATKNWPLEKFMVLAEKMSKQGYECVWIAGPAEAALSFPESGRIVRSAPLPVLVHLFSRCSLCVGNDSGISHLAAACGASCVVMFGPSDPVVWRPAGGGVSVITGDRSASIQENSVPRVFDECLQMIRKN
jgi:heptosyltransferase III